MFVGLVSFYKNPMLYIYTYMYIHTHIGTIPVVAMQSNPTKA